MRYPLVSFRTVIWLAAIPAGILPAPLASIGLWGTRLEAQASPLAIARRTVAADTAVFAGGCFWGIEGVFEHLKGVTSAVSGYSGGSVAAPSYEQVGSGTTGHAEAVRVVYDPAQITYAQLLEIFFTVAHDPTQRNRQGPDVGTQYRSVVFYRDAAQRGAVKAYVDKLGKSKIYAEPIVTEIVPLRAFYPAEEYHQNYLARHPTQPYIVIHDLPKVERLRREFPKLYRERQPD